MVVDVDALSGHGTEPALNLSGHGGGLLGGNGRGEGGVGLDEQAVGDAGVGNLARFAT